MTLDAARLPEDANVKLFLRHAIRYDNPVNGDYSALLLTPEGIRMAQEIGKSLDRPLGRLYGGTVFQREQRRFYGILARREETIP